MSNETKEDVAKDDFVARSTSTGPDPEGIKDAKSLPFDEVLRASVPDASLAKKKTRAALFGTAPVVPRVIGRFKLGRQVGRGAMGTVYKAHDNKLDRPVAVKLLRARQLESDAVRARARMLVEARAMAQIIHPNVVTVYEVGLTEDKGEPLVYLAMEFVGGMTLRQWHRSKTPSWSAVVQTYVQAGKGLAAVHAAGLVHRDFKPDNVMLDGSGRVLVMDFGLARETVRSTGRASQELETGDPFSELALGTTLTRSGELIGTPAYMAPEQLDGLTANTASDQYALCVSLYEALWGRRPFTGSTLANLRVAMMADPPSRPPGTQVPKRIVAAVLRGLHPEPRERFASMDALLAALQSPPRRRRVLVATVGVVGAAIGLGWAAWPTSSEPQCVPGEEVFAEAWNPTQARQIQDAFEETPVPAAAVIAQRVVTQLDTYAARWASQYDSTCGAAHEDLDTRMHCLQRRRREVQRLAGVLAIADETTIGEAEAAITLLTPSEHCSDPAFLALLSEPPTDPAILAEVHRVEEALALIAALTDTGAMAEALAKAKALEAESASLHYPPLAVEALFTYGGLEFGAGDPTIAAELIEKAYLDARALSVSNTAIEAALTLSSMHATITGDPEAAERWRRAAVSEIGDAPTLKQRSDLLAVEAGALFLRGNVDEGLELSHRRLVMLEIACASCENTAIAHTDLASRLGEFGRTGEALEHAERGLALAQALHEGEHEHVAAAYFTLGDTLDNAHRTTEAVVAWRHALTIREHTLGPHSANLAMTRAAYGSGLVGQGRVDEAIEQIIIARDVLAPIVENTTLAVVHNRLALAYRAGGRDDDARRSYLAAADAFSRSFPEGHPSLAVVLSNIAQLETDPGKKLVGLEAALEMRRATVKGPDLQQALLLHNIAEALTLLGRKSEAISRFREGAALTDDGSVDRLRLLTRLYLADLLWPEEPAAATEVMESLRVRCAMVDRVQQKSAECERVEPWLDSHRP